MPESTTVIKQNARKQKSKRSEKVKKVRKVKKSMAPPQIRAYFFYDFGPWTGPWASQTAYLEAPALGSAP